ncbi:hypothetical protein [Allokutzneria sp. NRRL B-24872]|uniref:hypothetical protein n=1 Tax=Allokutzneria sp. NRRL B-24872 TaxID=1137961 RepID=UPI000A3D04B8|nr:hypothetical protein [Allokutzneria sp. NRRL B-24872]
MDNGSVDMAPVPTERELLEDWMRVLTLLGEARPVEEIFELIARANRHDEPTGSIRVVPPCTHEDLMRVIFALRWSQHTRTAEANAHMVVDLMLIDRVSRATGETHSEVVRELAAEVAAMTG